MDSDQAEDDAGPCRACAIAGTVLIAVAGLAAGLAAGWLRARRAATEGDGDGS